MSKQKPAINSTNDLNKKGKHKFLSNALFAMAGAGVASLVGIPLVITEWSQ